MQSVEGTSSELMRSGMTDRLKNCLAKLHSCNLLFTTALECLSWQKVVDLKFCPKILEDLCGHKHSQMKPRLLAIHAPMHCGCQSSIDAGNANIMDQCSKWMLCEHPPDDKCASSHPERTNCDSAYEFCNLAANFYHPDNVVYFIMITLHTSNCTNLDILKVLINCITNKETKASNSTFWLVHQHVLICFLQCK